MALRSRWFVLLSSLFVVALIAAGCTKKGGGIDATLKDFTISLSASTVDAGKVTFNVQNDGPSAHEFVVVQTDTAEGDLPVGDDGTVEESALEVVDEKEDIPPDSSTTLEIDDLAAGSYVIICNIAGHYQQGMHAGLTAS
jgi:uncharacterized cupredoxin-like copper-binding protein